MPVSGASGPYPVKRSTAIADGTTFDSAYSCRGTLGEFAGSTTCSVCVPASLKTSRLLVGTASMLPTSWPAQRHPTTADRRTDQLKHRLCRQHSNNYVDVGIWSRSSIVHILFIHSFTLFSSRFRAHAYKKIKQYKPMKKKRKKIKRINTMYSATS